MPRSRRVSLCLRLLPVLALLLGAASPAAEAPFRGPAIAGQLAAPPKNETSGLAASRRTAGLLWVHDDSGGQPALYAVGPDGAARGSLQIGGGVKNDDWEDLAAAEFDGKAWLIIADTGDNDAKRSSVRVHFIEEPAGERLAGAAMLAERPAATLRIRYEDGARDCESLAIDARERALYLLTKRDTPPRLYRVALPAPLGHAELTARLAGPVPHLPPPSPAQRRVKGPLGRNWGFPCAMDFAPDGSAAVVLTSGDLLLFPRQGGEPWSAALARPPVRLPPHQLPQAEAVCFAPDGKSIFVASETIRTLLRYERR
ncbi:MAG: hypothetical protein FJ399_01965 [Verrucomicrobia bacterium]|nr:hypothetical protein [Verrucomicrobiota bacterium]